MSRPTLTFRPEPWMRDAECRAIAGFTELTEAEAVPVCVACPVRAACEDYAARSGSTHVVYAGRRLPAAPQLTLEGVTA